MTVETALAKRPRVGILDHASSAIGGAQYVNVCMAEVLSSQAEVELIHGGSGYTLIDLAHGFGMNLSHVRERILPWLSEVPSFGIPGAQPAFRQVRSSWALTRPYDVFIYSGLTIPPLCFAKGGLAYIHFPMDANMVAQARREGVNPLRERAYGLVWRAQRSSYDQWLANSDYTAGWMKRRWDQPAPVVYPPVEADFPQVSKRNLIVSIGRFTAGKRSKRQLEQIQVFREFCKKADEPWEFCLIGFCSKAREDREYLAMIQEAALGLPVRLVLDRDRRDCLRIVAEAKLFWHTAGFGIDELTHPESAEHFGIATVEAMRAGCVPIVIASGGQRETIQHGISGFLVQTLEELAETSVQLVNDASSWTAMSETAKKRSLIFTKEVFQNHISAVVAKMLR